jgi:hypothetical protein
VNKELENIVRQMRDIVNQEKPYSNIPKLPDLRDKFTDLYISIFDNELKPVINSIEDAKSRVLEVLNTKEYAKGKKDSYINQFSELLEGAEHCNNVSSLRSFGDKADALKLRLLREMDDLDAKLAKDKADKEARKLEEEAIQNGTEDSFVAEPKVEYKPRKTKRVPIKQITGTASWRLESIEDIEKYIDELRKNLEAQMDVDTIVNVEF